eukprot:s4628_g3.t1
MQKDVTFLPRKEGQQIGASLTDELLEAVRAAENAADQPPFSNEPTAIETQSAFVQELWEYWQDHATRDEAFQEPSVRVETWFIDHLGNDRCHHPRIVVLSGSFITWEATLVAAWTDRAVLGQETHYAMVYPNPKDMAEGVLMQVVLVQRAQEEMRSIVLSVYDTDPEVDPIRTFCLTLSNQISLESLLATLRLNDDCPPNECFLWFGSIPIHAHRVIHLRTGNALRLVLRRGVPVDIPALVSMPDHVLRHELQNAIGGTIFRRPSGPAFMRDVSAGSAVLPMQVGNEGN